MLKRILAATLGLIMLSACSNVQLPPDLDTQLGYTPEIGQAYVADLNWWRIYNDPQLDSLVELALANNLDLAKSAVSVNRALYQANLIGADLFPAFSGDASASARKNIRDGGPSTRSVGGEIEISYELDLWRKLADAANAAEWEYEATLEDLLAARLSLINSVVDVYFYLAYLNQAIEVTRDSLENYRHIETLTATKYDLGKVDALEQAQASQAFLSEQNNLIALETQAKGYEETLRNLLNLRPGESIPGANQRAENYPVPPLSYKFPNLLAIESPGVEVNVPLAVLANRPDLLAALNRVRSAFKDVQAENKSWLPAITLGAGLSSSSQQVRTAFNVPIAAGSIGISLPFLDWSRVYWQIKVSEAEFESLVLAYQQAITTALNEVDKYYYNYLRAAETLDITQSRHAHDVRITGYYQTRYEAGAAELSDWLSALNTETQSRLDLLRAKYSRIEYENALYQAMAGRYTATPAPSPATSPAETSF